MASPVRKHATYDAIEIDLLGLWGEERPPAGE